MTTIRSRWTRPAGAVLVLVAALVTAQACGVEAPSSPAAPVIGERGAQLATELTDTPTFTPFTAAPRLANRDEVGAALEANYTPALRASGVTGRAEIWVRISSEGVVERVSIDQTSGVAALDQAALAVGRVMKFNPAMNQDRAVAVWVSVPISFQLPGEEPATRATTAGGDTQSSDRQRGAPITVTGTRRFAASAGGADRPAIDAGNSLLADGRFDEALAAFRGALAGGQKGDEVAHALYRDAVTRGIRREDWSYALRGLIAAKTFATTSDARAELDFWHGWALYHEAMRVEKPQNAESAALALPMFEQARMLFEAGADFASRSGANLPKIFDAVDTYVKIQTKLLKR